MVVTKVDVAKKAGVSSATVSNVINNTKYVSSELRIKVEEAIRELNYKPNMIAKSLATKTTKHVGILIDNITNPYYAEIAEGMEEVAHKNDYIVSLCIVNDDLENYLTDIIRRRMDGLFLATTKFSLTKEQIKKLEDNNIAIIKDGTFNQGIIIDYSTATRKLMKYFFDLGHKRIGFLNGIPDIRSKDIRYVEYHNCLMEHNLYDSNIVVDAGYPYGDTYKNGYITMKTLLSVKPRVTAVFAVNDLMAFGAIKAINEAGLKVPQDISVAGCDDIFLCECMNPTLTTLRVSKRDIGREAMNLLLKLIREKKKESVTFEMELIVRDSTGKAPDTSK